MSNESTLQMSLAFDDPTQAAVELKPVENKEISTRKKAGGKEPRKRVSAEALATKQRDISVSEFFSKNRHLLGFDNPAKALLTTVKEAVDNSLDACEEAGILPDVVVEVIELGADRYRVSVQDNGPGIVKAEVPKIFGKLLYGSKFHTLKQSRGQQGIGISAAGMFGLITTGKPMVITTRTSPRHPAYYYELRIDTAKNKPEILTDTEVEWGAEHGTRVEIEIAASYRRGQHSVDTYLEQTAVANPHASLWYTLPGQEEVSLLRTSGELPPEPREMRPHPHGVELGMLMKLLREQKGRGKGLRGTLVEDFSRVTSRVADEICEKAGLPPETRPHLLSPEQIERLHKAISEVKIMAPPSDCVVPIGEELIRKGLERKYKADFFTSSTRPPTVYRGNPFVIEVGIAYGGDLPGDEPAEIMRFANRVPLQYQKSACSITEAVMETNWKSYGIQQSKGGPPVGPLAVLIHVASAWVPFTSESKEAIAHYPEIIREMKLGLQECGRRLGLFLSHRRREADAMKKLSYIEKYIPHIGEALKEILKLSEKDKDKMIDTLTLMLERSRSV